MQILNSSIVTELERRETIKCPSDLLLVSTYVVCERLSVMHEPAGVVENLVQILQNTPYSVIQNTPPIKAHLGTLSIFSYRIPPPFRHILGLWVFSVTEYPPHLGTSWDFEYFQLQNTPPHLGTSWDFEYFQLQNTPPARSWYFLGTHTHIHTHIYYAI